MKRNGFSNVSLAEKVMRGAIQNFQFSWIVKKILKEEQKMNIQDKLKTLPSSPGVYFMKDSAGNVIYVGKSKNLKARVGSYFWNI